MAHTVAKSWTGLKRLSTQHKVEGRTGPQAPDGGFHTTLLRWSNVTHVGALVLG